MWSIYKIENRRTGKAYIGFTGQRVSKRWEVHCSEANVGTRMRCIHAALRKHGFDAFTFEVIGTAADAETAKAMEQLAIRVYGSIAPGGYNLTAGGDGMLTPSPETRAKMRAAQIGRKQASETIEKRRQKQIGRRRSPEAIERSAAARRGATRSDAFKESCRKRANTQFSDPAARARVSELLRAKWADPAYREAMLSARRKEAK
jgi:group I intron endonuclease